ncbi:hypothetical protein H9Y04_09875 [Streptomyces sp. TRM66268-LWL]|uniref:Uncharacterized protein n=2 Tax=Streptomyces polyasparticus TaxID=2767826 RepID=A0ABR7SCJ2_9ACTN|nr:hypothetical protein [Streptomyces polyasparticus]
MNGGSVLRAARLVATVPAPLEPGSADAPFLQHTGGRRLVVQRADTELAVLDTASGDVVRFPAPWPRSLGTVAVSPSGDIAVFAGLHAVRAVAASGATLWELRHACWADECPEMHEEFGSYADDCDEGGEHEYAGSGSAAFSCDGKLLWAHVRGPLAADGAADDAASDEFWLVLDAADGRVLARTSTGTVASGSFHTVHPDPAQMGLSVGEGEEGSPALWGRLDGGVLSVRKIDDETVLLDASPSGRHLLATDVQQDALYLHAAEDGTILRDLDADGAVPPHSQGGRVYWDFAAAFTDESTAVAGTSGSDAGYGPGRHWLIGTDDMAVRALISYPRPVSGPVRAAGEGAWYTVSEDRTAVLVWELAQES